MSNPADGVTSDHVSFSHSEDGLAPGQAEYRATDETSHSDSINWSVMVYKHRHELDVYYKGRFFKRYHAVFGRNAEPGAKQWAGDRRTPEGVYTIVGKHRSRRWRWFLALNYPNEVDRARYVELRYEGEVPTSRGRPVGLGDRIGIHGTDQPILNRGNVNWTTGCISVDNDDIVELYKLLPTGTLVIIKP